MGYKIDVIYTDFSKVFDREDHEILLLKFPLIDIPDIIHRWLGSYLSLRTKRVLFRNVLSNPVLLKLKQIFEWENAVAEL